jgi:hypothetical protein
VAAYYQIVDSNECPANPEGIAEAYVMGTLGKEQVIAFEDHYVTCSQCATVLQKTAEYVEAMRAVSRKARSDQK